MTDPPVAVVTAAGRGIGAACARRLADDGYRPVLLSKTGAARDVAAELDGIGLEGSVTDDGDLGRLVDEAIDAYGGIDAVVNNTGHPPTGDLLDITDDEWHDAMDLVLLNVVRLARYVTPVLVDQGGGAIVNVSTFSAFEPSPDFPTSSVLRAGLGSFTKLYADRYAADGIRMNAVLPGYVDTYGIDESTRESIPMGRRGHTDEIADTVAYLLSDEASYLTGQNITVDGGLTRSV